MVGICLRLSTLCLLFISSQVTAQSPPPDFMTIWEVDAGDTITFPGEGEYTIDWGDGMMEETVTDVMSVKHTYAMASKYTIIVSNDITRFNLKNSKDGTKLESIKQWGTAKWSSMEDAFRGAVNMRMRATDKPNLSEVTSMLQMFFDAKVFNGDVSNWDVRNVTNMDSMFQAADAFNQDINGWDVSNVTSMVNMFNNADAFNQDINGWDVSNVTSMVNMFNNADAFNGDIGDWVVSNVTNMRRMFSSADAFNQDIGDWDVSNVTNMRLMFSSADAFNQDISGWKVGNVTDMGDMFNDASVFSQNLGSWYAVGTQNADYDGVDNFVILNIAAQNAPLRAETTTRYILDAGDGDIDNNRFTLTEGGALSVRRNMVKDGSYSIRVKVMDATFGTSNVIVLPVQIAGNPGTTTPDISGDGKVNGKDALLLYFVLTFREFVGDGARGSVKHYGNYILKSTNLFFAV